MCEGCGHGCHFSNDLEAEPAVGAPWGKPRGVRVENSGCDWLVSGPGQGPAMGPQWWGLRLMGKVLDL